MRDDSPICNSMMFTRAKVDVWLAFFFISLLALTNTSADENIDKNSAEFSSDEIKEGWNILPNLNKFNSEDENEIFKRGNWNDLRGSWGKRAPDALTAADMDDITNRLLYESAYPEEGVGSTYNGLQMETPLKRTWNKFAGAWGKRPFATRALSPRSTNWSSLRGSWGKRGGDWSALRGTWGKRNT